MKLISSSDEKRKKHLQAMVTNVTLTQKSSNLINHIKLENYCNLLRTLKLHLQRKISQDKISSHQKGQAFGGMVYS